MSHGEERCERSRITDQFPLELVLMVGIHDYLAWVLALSGITADFSRRRFLALVKLVLG